MRYDWMDGYLLSKRAVTRDLQPDWNWIRYKVGDRMFAAMTMTGACCAVTNADPTVNA